MTPAEVSSLAEAKTMVQDGNGSRTLLGAAADVRPPSRSRTPMLLGLALVAGVIGVGAFFATRSSESAIAQGDAALTASATAVPPPVQDTPAIATSVARPASTTEVTPAADQVEIEIDSVPEKTEVFLGEERLGVVPGIVRLRRGAEKVVLTLKATGHKPLELPLTPDKNRAIAAPAMVKIPVPGPAKAVNKKGGRGDLEEAF
jgi:hypothetical protein